MFVTGTATTDSLEAPTYIATRLPFSSTIGEPLLPPTKGLLCVLGLRIYGL